MYTSASEHLRLGSCFRTARFCALDRRFTNSLYTFQSLDDRIKESKDSEEAYQFAERMFYKNTLCAGISSCLISNVIARSIRIRIKSMFKLISRL